jgi:hypothetical protein
MALISAATIIRSMSLFHITLAFFFLTSPTTIADQTLVFVIGEAMSLVSWNSMQILNLKSNYPQPSVRAFEIQSAPLAFLAAVLGVFGISDLVAISMPEEMAMYHWGTQSKHSSKHTSDFFLIHSSADPTISLLLPHILLFRFLSFLSYVRLEIIHTQWLGRGTQEQSDIHMGVC